MLGIYVNYSNNSVNETKTKRYNNGFGSESGLMSNIRHVYAWVIISIPRMCVDFGVECRFLLNLTTANTSFRYQRLCIRISEFCTEISFSSFLFFRFRLHFWWWDTQISSDTAAHPHAFFVCVYEKAFVFDQLYCVWRIFWVYKSDLQTLIA